MRKPFVTLIDAALPARQFQVLQRRITALHGERMRASYRTTFWYDLSEPPACLVEDAVLLLRARLPKERSKKVIGVEWWLSRMRTSNVQVDFHRDLDTERLQRTGVEVNPTVSSLLYLNRCRGGLLAVTTAPPNPKNDALAPDEHDFDVVEPTPNRFAFFRGTLTHGVLDANNCIPGRRLPTEPHFRLAIAINWWHQRPLDVPRFTESSHYRSLATRRRSR
jgi:hypothetical protein